MIKHNISTPEAINYVHNYIENNVLPDEIHTHVKNICSGECSVDNRFKVYNYLLHNSLDMKFKRCVLKLCYNIAINEVQ